MLNAATRANLDRKRLWVDAVQMHNGVPLPSLIEINPTELCTRACSFCPRSDPAFYPNQNLHMPVTLARKMGDELRGLDFLGGVSFCGYGEPLLHPKLEDLTAAFGGIRCEIVTSGDGLTIERIKSLWDAGMSYFVVSLYDGAHQVEDFKARFAAAGVDAYILRDRWHDAAEDFGLKLTNRAGAVSAGNQEAVTDRPCHYTAYSTLIDWNGDVLLCPQDWTKRTKFGSVAFQTLLEVWTSRAMHKRRKQLMRGRASLSPCSTCNTNGCLHGAAHVTAWKA